MNKFICISFCIAVAISISCGKSEAESFTKNDRVTLEARALEVYRGEPEYMVFEDFLKAFKEAVKARDRKKLVTLMVDVFVDDEAFPDRDSVARQIAVEKINFDLLERITSMGYSMAIASNGEGGAFSPPVDMNHNEKYGISFFRIDDPTKSANYTIPKGWRLTSVYRGD